MIWNLNYLYLDTLDKIDIEYEKMYKSLDSLQKLLEKSSEQKIEKKIIKKNKRVDIMTNPIVNVNHVKIFPKYCIENNKKIIGYNIHIKYSQSKFIIGPLKSYKFVTELAKKIKTQLSNFRCNRTNYKSIIQKYFDELNQEIQKKCKILDSYSKKKLKKSNDNVDDDMDIQQKMEEDLNDDINIDDIANIEIDNDNNNLSINSDNNKNNNTNNSQNQIFNNSNINLHQANPNDFNKNIQNNNNDFIQKNNDY